MPNYTYRCPANGQVHEVLHGMQARLATWGELCVALELAPGDTPADAPLERDLGGFAVLDRLGEPERPCGKSSCGCFGN